MSTPKDQSELGGMFGESVMARKIRGKLILKNKPKRKPVTLDKSKSKFFEASSYGKDLTDESKAIYATGINSKMRSAYMVAVSDYLSAPKVGPIDTNDYKGAIGNPIVVKAVDDFMVTRVKVTITDANGNELEAGEAAMLPEKKFFWKYEATVANPVLKGLTITALAYDRAGNNTSFEKVL
ncbi:hypothetical protein BH10BAC4_BH10BAC4_21870 [soil metagenome]